MVVCAFAGFNHIKAIHISIDIYPNEKSFKDRSSLANLRSFKISLEGLQPNLYLKSKSVLEYVQETSKTIKF